MQTEQILISLLLLLYIFSFFLFCYSVRSLVFCIVIKRRTNDPGIYSFQVSQSKNQRKSERGVSYFASDAKKKASVFANSVISNSQQYYNELLNRDTDNDTNQLEFYPFISILVATHNELLVIDRLMRSLTSLTYNRDKFEVIIVDDSDDGTDDFIRRWAQFMRNLKFIHRDHRSGWKGGALNVALGNLNNESEYVLVVDADTYFLRDTLERFVSFFGNSLPCRASVSVIQGYPVSIVYDRGDKYVNTNFKAVNANWVARGIAFRLAQRNMVEFLAKEILNLPLQITGSLFMIRSNLIRRLGFKTDLTEDWDLTLDLYLDSSVDPHSFSYNNRINYTNSCLPKKIVSFNPTLACYCEATTSFGSYFRQRMRVSEGHTRAFKRNFIPMLKGKVTTGYRIEFFFNGLQYAKFIALFALILIDSAILSIGGINFIVSNNFVKIPLFLQAAMLFIDILTRFVAVPLCCTIMEDYTRLDAVYTTFLNVFTLPAFVLGSLRGFFKNEGVFYRTQRNA